MGGLEVAVADLPDSEGEGDGAEGLAIPEPPLGMPRGGSGMRRLNLRRALGTVMPRPSWSRRMQAATASQKYSSLQLICS